VLILVVALFAVALAKPEYDLSRSHKDLFAMYLKDYDVELTAAELPGRFRVFSDNVNKVNELNAAAQAAGRNTRFTVNKFALLSNEEFRAIYLNARMPADWTPSKDSTFAPIATKAEIGGLPNTYDWRTVTPPVVTPVKNQGQCGSCYTFSTTGNMEGVWALAGNPLVSLSEQNLMDCDHTCIDGVCDGGCDGGLMANAFTWIVKNGGLESEADYPYQGVNGKCQFDKSKIVASITNFTFITKTAPQMQAFLFKNGPISIAADATMWQYYYSGVWYFYCGTSLDHGILIVGWGTETDMFGQTMPYWIVKNSWGKDWGVNGYILIERGNDECGLQKYPISALITKS